MTVNRKVHLRVHARIYADKNPVAYAALIGLTPKEMNSLIERLLVMHATEKFNLHSFLSSSLPLSANTAVNVESDSSPSKEKAIKAQQIAELENQLGQWG